MSEEIVAGGATPPAPVTPPAPAAPPPAGGSSRDSWHEEKISRLNADIAKERETLKAERTARTKAEQELQTYRIKEKKSGALDKAIGGLGEDFEIPADKMPDIHKGLAALQDSDALDDTVASIVNLAKVPKSKGKPSFTSPFNAGSGSAPAAKLSDMTNAERVEFARTDPDGYRAAMQGSTRLPSR